MTTAFLAVTREGEAVDLVIEGTATPAEPDCRRGHPDNWYEGAPAEAEVERIVLDDGRGTVWTGELTRKEEREAEARLIEALADEVAA